MKFKQFKKEINQDSDLLKLSGKDLAAIFEIDVLKAKYFKKRYKEELQFAVEFDINDTKWFDTLVNQSSTSKPKDWVNSDTYNEDWFKSLQYGTDNLKPIPIKNLKVDFSDLKNTIDKVVDNYGTKTKLGNIVETNCTCPVCKESIVLESFNSGKNLVECPECYTLLLLEDNVVERFTVELPKSNVSIESLMNDISKIAEETIHKKVLNVIRAIRNSFVGSEIVYTKGSCYQFYLILREVFPQAVAFYDENHLVTMIEDKYYDITGEVSKGRCLPFTPTPNDIWINEPYNIFKIK